ncbi:MAG: succinate dehydrogenase iron-sulfur subunit [Thaumarchaeota archaeon]|nr:succinate dehydrogenase iron-sulfur subunit [Nitrososphaerota archaeon]
MTIEEKEKEKEEITLKIVRSTPSKNIKPKIATYTIPVTKGMTVLDALQYIKANIDHSIAFRYSCRMGNCGSCAVIANNKPILSCQTQIADLGGREIELRPLENFPVIRDLVTSFNEFNSKHRQIKPYIIIVTQNGDEKEIAEEMAAKHEHLQSPEELERYIQFAHCIKCGLCFNACPITSTNIQFLGPQALSQAYRYLEDNRDQDNHLRLEIVDTKNGCWSCHLIGECSYACPKGVDPALGIQLLRRKATAQKLGVTKQQHH